MTSQTLGAAAGWYPDGHGAIRYFDGSAWTEHTHTEPAAQTAVVEDAPAQAEADEPFYKQGWFFVDVAFLALIVAIIAIASVT